MVQNTKGEKENQELSVLSSCECYGIEKPPYLATLSGVEGCVKPNEDSAELSSKLTVRAKIRIFRAYFGKESLWNNKNWQYHQHRAFPRL